MVLKELCALRGVSGDESRVREYIAHQIAPYVQDVKVDRMGNLIAFKKGTGEDRRHILLSTHMDEVGMIVKGINDNGLLAYDTIGEIDPRTVISKPVRVGEDEIPGVIGAKAIHLQTAEDRMTMLPHSKLFIEIGAKDRASAEKLVELGDVVSFEGPWREFGDGLVKSRALESRMGCAILMSILEEEYPCDITCVFTVQSNVGSLGAKAAAYNVSSAAALILDAAIAKDLDDPDSPQVCSLRKGSAISMMDRAAIASIPLYARLKDLAEEQGIPVQDKYSVTRGGDAGAYQRASGARSVCVLSTPCRYMHTASNVVAFSDIDAQYRLVDAFLKTNGAF